MSTDTPANYQDPAPPLQHNGWGFITETPTERFNNERRMLDAMPMIATSEAYTQKPALDEAIEKAVRAKFTFDKGWNFWTVQEMVYGTIMMITQNIGNCVGASHAAALAAKIAYEILVLGQPEEPLGQGQLAQPFIPYSYGVGRREGNMLGPGDGSYCSVQMKGTERFGMLPCSTPGLEAYAGSGEDALPQGTASAGRLFGRSNAEIKKWEDKAIKFKMGTSVRVKDADEVWTMITEKRTPLQICSNRGFKYGGKDKNGIDIYVPGPTWSHSMTLMMACEYKGTMYVGDGNQWGRNAHKGDATLGVPPGCMVIRWEDLETWCRIAEIMDIGEIDGMPSKPEF